MENTLDVYVLTHCESCYNRRGIFTGRVNSKLTENGRKHAQVLAKTLQNKKIDIAFVSPLSRAKETLRYILKYHPKTKIVIDQRLIERDYGELSRKSKSKYKKDHPDLYPLYHRSYDVAPPGGESMQEVEKRVLNFLHDVIGQMKNKSLNVLIITHGNSIRPILKYFEHLTNQQMMNIEHLRHTVFHYTINT